MSRKIFRAYAQANGKEAKEFVEIQNEQYNLDTLITKDNSGKIEESIIVYKSMLNWIFKNYHLTPKKKDSETF